MCKSCTDPAKVVAGMTDGHSLSTRARGSDKRTYLACCLHTHCAVVLCTGGCTRIHNVLLAVIERVCMAALCQYLVVPTTVHEAWS